MANRNRRAAEAERTSWPKGTQIYPLNTYDALNPIADVA